MTAAVQEHCSESGQSITPDNLKVTLAVDNTLKRKIKDRGPRGQNKTPLS